MNETEQARAAYARRKGRKYVPRPEVQAPPVVSPWAPKRHPAFERRLTQHKLTLIKMLGGRIAT